MSATGRRTCGAAFGLPPHHRRHDLHLPGPARPPRQGDAAALRRPAGRHCRGERRADDRRADGAGGRPARSVPERGRHPLRGRRGHPPRHRQPRRQGVCARGLADGRRLSRLAAVGRRDGRGLAQAGARHHPGNGGRGLKADAQPGPDPGGAEMRGRHRLSQHHRPEGPDEHAAAAQPSLRRCQGHHRLDPRRPAARGRRCLHRHQSGERRSGRHRAIAAAAGRDHRAAEDPDARLRADPCHHDAVADRAGRAGRPRLPVGRRHRGRQSQLWHRPRAAEGGAARPGCRRSAARSART